MRWFLLGIERDENDRVSGQLARLSGPPAPFSGWLELLHLLEDDTGNGDAGNGGVADDGTGGDAGERDGRTGR